jgi:hypothetical protein
MNRLQAMKVAQSSAPIFTPIAAAFLLSPPRKESRKKIFEKRRSMRSKIFDPSFSSGGR